ncbi:competence type IV pilus ATPase ComGA [Listeria costaricensis]|uniref:competence type IV pilus ATPase ComGA n=1 Tax=Listeria costaricensis TaxID=2026604 RepID=UPI000C08D22D|nr:competence type IV pilus ATPase ComGA [Listeria costaricensis]
MPQQKLTALLTSAKELRASDIHLSPRREDYHCYFRMNGDFCLIETCSITEAQKLITYLKFQASMDIGEKRRPQTGQYEISLDQQRISLRLSTLLDKSGLESLVIRLFSEGDILPFYKSTPFLFNCLQMFQNAEKNSGLLLFSGKTGSGKSSSMYGLAELLYQHHARKIVTIENPVEHYHQAFLQIEINEKAGLTYQEILREVLRHDPDIIIIGEIRDSETAQMAIRAALTGHLVLSTVHAGSLKGILNRLTELGLSKSDLAEGLIGISHQRIFSLYCPLCDGKCQPYCTHLKEKRTVLYEYLENEAIWQQSARFISISHQFQKGVCYGYFKT